MPLSSATLGSLRDHVYACNSSGQQSTTPLHAYTTLATLGSANTIEVPTVPCTMSVKEGDVVHLLDKCDKQVGIGSILGGSRLHGNELPTNFVKIAVKEINVDVRPWPEVLSAFDDSDEQVLFTGSITGWPHNKLAVIHTA